jgi:hypothetical protein
MASPGNFGTAVCEVCAQPMPAGAQPVRVGACEFPFHVHEDCFAAMGPLAEEVTQMCAAAAPEEQPEGLLWLGSWDPRPTAESDPVESSP